jgi:peptidoglycan hydrolase CwlO-like protein
MAASRNDKLISECAELRADNASLKAQLAELRAECSRKEEWINRYALQLKHARRKAASQATPSDRRAAMEAAKAEAMASGRCVTVHP